MKQPAHSTGFTAAELAKRTLGRRAIEAIMWGIELSSLIDQVLGRIGAEERFHLAMVRQ